MTQDLQSVVDGLKADLKAEHDRVTAHEAKQKQIADDLQKQIDALKQAGAPQAIIDELTAMRTDVQGFDPDVAPPAPPAPPAGP